MVQVELELTPKIELLHPNNSFRRLLDKVLELPKAM
jgi:hypothetical protein